MTRATRPLVLVIALLGSALSGWLGWSGWSGCASTPRATPSAARASSDPATAAEAAAWLTEVNAKLKALWVAQTKAEWTQVTDITPAHDEAAGRARAKTMAFLAEAAAASHRFDGVAAPPLVRRQLTLLRRATSLPAPKDEAQRAELAKLATEMESLYGKAKICLPRGAHRGVTWPADLKAGPAPGTDGRCRDLDAGEEVLATSQDPALLLAVWRGWREAARPLRTQYERFVGLANAGARDAGFGDLGALWRARYDREPAAFEADMDRLWQQVAPLYRALHCHVRAKLVEEYGAEVVPPGGPLPAHLLGNMWAQEWTNLYPRLVPYPNEPSLDVGPALVSQGYTPRKMVRLGERFFVSLGLDPLPATFWERSMFERPPKASGREVVCHASAWDVSYDNDLRVKMCIRPTMEDLTTIHHELGHDYYFHAYHRLPVLLQDGANDGFHEAIGDTIALSVTPRYLHDVGLLEAVSDTPHALVNAQLREALDKVAFLPFGLLVDKWRWGVFSGAIPPSRYNAAWWALRRRYQGVAPPAPRTEADFDPGAKYHVASNTSYARYFVAQILQFQLHAALCRAAGQTGPLYACSIYGSKAAGAKLQAMLALGASRPWQDVLEAVAGTRELDAQPMLDYYAPLAAYLAQQNKGRTCGW